MTKPLDPHLRVGNVVSAETYRLFAFGDFHFGYVDSAAVRCALKAACIYNPHEIVLLGDLLDFYSISKYLKDPRRIDTIQDEIDAAVGFLFRLRRLFPRSKIVLLEGNHEQRMHKDICRRAPEYRHLRILDICRLLDLDRFEIDWVPETEFYRVGPVRFTHGESASKYASSWHLAKYGASIVCGHTHRLQCRHQRTVERTLTSWEAGCMCSFDVGKGYQKHPDWQHGFLTARVWRETNRAWIQGHLIDRGTVILNGNVINGNDK